MANESILHTIKHEKIKENIERVFRAKVDMQSVNEGFFTTIFGGYKELSRTIILE
jgi:hypothetical protein